MLLQRDPRKADNHDEIDAAMRLHVTLNQRRWLYTPFQEIYSINPNSYPKRVDDQ